MIKFETQNLAVLAKPKKDFAKFCKTNGYKIYVAAAEALTEWLEKKKGKSNV